MSRQVSFSLAGKQSDLPIYQQVSEALKKSITSEYALGDYLPSEHDLSSQFGVNRHTIRRAIEELISAGLVLRKQGKGSLVINNQIHYSLKQGRFTATLDKLGRHSRSELLNSSIINADAKVSAYLGLRKGHKVIVMETLRFVDDQPISIITHYLNPVHTPQAQERYKGGSLHAFIESTYGLTLVRQSALIAAVMPSSSDAFSLKCTLNQALLRIKSFNTKKDNPAHIVEVSISRNRADKFQIEVPCLD
ncbi:MAG: phosphonate metabolism transcriptional regulator PhnF [Pseudomonadota bacterium]